MNLYPHPFVLFFFFNDTATTEIYTLSLHDALPISICREQGRLIVPEPHAERAAGRSAPGDLLCGDRKSTRLNSSHSQNSYAVFCLKKKKHTICCMEHPDVVRSQYPMSCHVHIVVIL